MTVLNDADIALFALPGLAHRTLTGPVQDRTALEIWKQTLAPGAATPVHRHDCEELVVILTGTGRLEIEGVPSDFGAASTLFVPARAVHQIVNTGTEDMLLVAAFPKRPTIEAPDGTPIPVPWRAEP